MKIFVLKMGTGHDASIAIDRARNSIKASVRNRELKPSVLFYFQSDEAVVPRQVVMVRRWRSRKLSSMIGYTTKRTHSGAEP